MASSTRAVDRTVNEWFSEIGAGHVRLPRFQRHEAWDNSRAATLLTTVIKDLPLGVALVLRVGDEEKFVSRPLASVEPPANSTITEHLLDGQQRLTALWRALHGNYPDVTFLVRDPQLDGDDSNDEEELEVVAYKRWVHRDGRSKPFWVDEPAGCLQRGFIPVKLLNPLVNLDEEWLDIALAADRPTPESHPSDDLFRALTSYQASRDDLKNRIVRLRETVKHFNLPYLLLPATTPKDVALDVFINMNTNSKPLKPYDVLVAEFEAVSESSLHDTIDRLRLEFSRLQAIEDLEWLVIQTATLLQDKPITSKGALEMSALKFFADESRIRLGLGRLEELLGELGIVARALVPTTTVLPVLAALLADAPEYGDARGRVTNLLRRYAWTAFLSRRYEASSPTRAFSDYRALRSLVSAAAERPLAESELSAVPLFLEFKLPEKEELLAADWPKRRSTLGRAILLATVQSGANDFADNRALTADNFSGREYHHIFPDKLLSDAGIESYLSINCALITWRTNRTIGRQSPLEYLANRAEGAPSEHDVVARLMSHTLPAELLIAAGPYTGLSDEEFKTRVANDWAAFLSARGDLVLSALELLSRGERV